MNIFNDYDSIKESVNENKYLKVGLYIAGGIACIWILGKGSLLLADAANNFKRLFSEFKAQ
jgi:hypothetical protein